MSIQKRLFPVIALTLLSAAAHASPTCTTQPKTEWMNEQAFQEKLKTEGYEIRKFKVTSDQCYEIYGKDKNGQKVEIYFNPVDGSVVKSKRDED
jgi:hypothetical protein